MEFNATFIISFISFIIFIIIMNYILYKPIGNIVEKRKQFIDENYTAARENHDKSQAILKDKKDKLDNTRKSVKEKTNSALDKAKEEKSQIELSAKEEAKLKIEKNLEELNVNRQEAVSILKKDVINLAQIISDKFIDSPDKITDIDNEIIEKIMQE